MKPPVLLLLGFAFIASFTSLSQAADLVAPGAKVEKLADGFRFTEGPAVDARGNVYFTDIPNNRILKWSPAGKLTTHRENSGAANGLFFDSQGRLVACEGGSRRVTREEKDGTISVLAERWDGKKFNSPNDLWIATDGGIYFTDPRYGSMDGLEMKGFHVYYIPPNGKVTRILDNFVKPNGIIGSADGKRLYITDAGDRKTYVYKIGEHGALSDRKLAAPRGSDGMTLDSLGNLYLTGGGVHIYGPDGNKIQTIEVPEGPANVTFGGQAGRTLFITARTGFYSVRMTVSGRATPKP